MLVSMNPAVSSMRFGNGNNVNDILSRPGAFTRPESTNEPTVNAPAKKKSGYGKKVLKLVVGAALIAGALVALRKNFPSIFKIEKNAELTGYKKYLEYATTGIGKAGEYIANKCSSLLKVFKKEKAEEVANAALNVVS